MGLKEKAIGILMVVFSLLALLNTFNLLDFAGEATTMIMVFLSGVFALLGILFFVGLLN